MLARIVSCVCLGSVLLVSVATGGESPTATDRLKAVSESLQASDVNTIHKLIKEGADVDAKNKDGAPLLHAASQRGHVQIVKLLLKSGADVDIAHETHKVFTPLLIASREGHAKVVELLIEAEADIEAVRKREGGTSLYLASYKGHAEVVKLLLKAGADLNVGCSVRHINSLFIASAIGHVEVVKLLLEAGADVNRTGEQTGWPTSLHIASTQGHTQIVKMLLEANADVNAKVGPKGKERTALSTAKERGHKEVVRLLEAAVAKDVESEAPAKAERQIYALEFTKKIYSERSNNGVAFVGDRPHRLERWILDPVCNRPRPMTPAERKKYPTAKDLAHPSNLSPNGEKMVVSRKTESGGFNLHVIDMKSKSITRLSPKKRVETSAVFTPQGKIVFLARAFPPDDPFAENGTSSEATEFREVDAEGNDTRRLESPFPTNTPTEITEIDVQGNGERVLIFANRSILDGVLSPDAGQLAYTDGGPYIVKVYLLDLHKKTSRLVAGDARGPRWIRFSIPLEAKQDSK